MCLYFLCNSVIYSSSFSLSCSPQATKPKYCLDRSYMLSLFSDPVSLYMCNNSRNGAILSGSLIFRSPLRFLTFSISYYHFTRIFSEILYTKKTGYRNITYPVCSCFMKYFICSHQYFMLLKTLLSPLKTPLPYQPVHGHLQMILQKNRHSPYCF